MSRRGHGEGCIRQRQDGRWTAILSLGHEDGKRRRKTFYGRTRREVADKLSAAQAGLQKGMQPVPERQTLESFAADWLASKRTAIRPSTAKFYETSLRLHILPAIGKVSLSKLTPQHVERLRASLLSSGRERRLTGQPAGLDPRSVSHVLVLLRNILKTAERWGLVGRNVARLVDSPRVEGSELAAITPADAAAIIEAVKGHRMEHLVVVSLGTGLRQGEALALKWSEVDIERRTLTVRRALQRVKVDGGTSRLQEVEPKTPSSRRTVPLPAGVVEALLNQKARQREERLLAGPAWRDRGYVFTTPIGTGLEGTNLVKTSSSS